MNQNARLNFPSYLPEIRNDFVGRENELENLDFHFKNNQIVALSAFAGTGKSTLALEYSYRAKKKENILVRWFNADSIEKFEVDYKNFADLIDIKVAKKNINYIIQKLNFQLEVSGLKTLFVFDNLEEMSYVKSFLNGLPLNVKILITTRNQLYDNLLVTLNLEPFDLNEAQTYVNKNLKDRIDAKQMNRIIQMSKSNTNQVLPIKIERVIFYIKENFISNIDTLLDNIQFYDYHNNRVEFMLLFEIRIQYPEAFLILQYCSFLNPDFIPLNILVELDKQSFSNELETQNKIKQLNKLSLVTTINKNKKFGVKIHRLVQEEVRYLTEKNEKDTNYTNNMEIFNQIVECLESLFEKANNDPSSWKQNEDYYLQALTLMQNLNDDTVMDKLKNDLVKNKMIELINKISYYEYYAKFDMEKSLQLDLKAFELRKRMFPNNHSQISESYYNIGVSCGKLGEHSKSLEYKIKAFELKCTLNPNDYKGLAESLNGIGLSYSKLGDYQKSLENYMRAYDIRKKVYQNENNRDIVESLNNIGVSYYKIGDYHKSLEYKLKAYEIWTKISPKDSLELSTVLNNIGVTYGDIGNYEKSYEYYLKAYEMRNRLLPQNHPDLAKSKSNVEKSLEIINNNKQNAFFYKFILIFLCSLFPIYNVFNYLF